MATKNQHVIPHNGKWAIKSEGSERITSVYDTKQEAIDAARYIARSQGVTVYIHGKNGQLLLGAKVQSRIDDDKIIEAVRVGIPPMMRSAKQSKERSKKSSARSRRGA